MRVQFRPLADVADIFVGVPTKISQAENPGHSVKVLSVRSLTDNGIDEAELVSAEVQSEITDKYRTRVGDVLIPSRSTSLKAGIVTPCLAGTPINSTLIGIRCTPELDPLLFYAYLRHPDGQAAIAEHTQSGTAQMNITVKGLSELPVPVPRRESQPRIAAMLVATDDAYRSAVDAAEQRRRLAMEVIFEKMTSA